VTHMTDYLSHLNQNQREAVLHTKGPLLIVAGAGAGKTQALTYRIFNLIKNGVNPSQILAVTFTNKAAKEMKERIHTLMRNSGMESLPFEIGERPFIGTFHSLGVHILRENSALLNIKKNFTIKDQGDSLALIREAIKQNNLDTKQFEPKRFRSIISRQKGERVTVEEYDELAQGEFFRNIVASVWRTYEKSLREENALDFDDLLLKPVELLEKNASIRSHYQERWRYVHIDEYQDTNAVQYLLSRLLAEKHSNICVVGDSDQNIYSWRGANIKNILRFEKDYPGARIILLEENYRSTEKILTAANKVIQKNTLRAEKNLFTRKSGGENLSLFIASNEEEEAYFIAATCENIIKTGVLPENIAVLYRANFQSRILEEIFLRCNLPYQIIGTRFFERKEVKDILSFLRAALNPESLSDIKRIINVPPRGIGKVTIAKIFAGQRDSLPLSMRTKVTHFYTLLEKIKKHSQDLKLSQLVKSILKESRIDEHYKNEGEEGKERLENIKELATLATKYDSLPTNVALEKFLEDAALASDQDELMKNGKGVRLMTVHASKGLEFQYVFIAGLEQGLFPHEYEGKESDTSESGLERSEEERRLFYVAITRAAKKLYLTLAEQRTLFGTRHDNLSSEFLSDIDEDLLDLESMPENAIDTITFD